MLNYICFSVYSITPIKLSSQSIINRYTVQICLYWSDLVPSLAPTQQHHLRAWTGDLWGGSCCTWYWDTSSGSSGSCVVGVGSLFCKWCCCIQWMGWLARSRQLWMISVVFWGTLPSVHSGGLYRVHNTSTWLPKFPTRTFHCNEMIKIILSVVIVMADWCILTVVLLFDQRRRHLAWCVSDNLMLVAKSEHHGSHKSGGSWPLLNRWTTPPAAELIKRLEITMRRLHASWLQWHSA